MQKQKPLHIPACGVQAARSKMTAQEKGPLHMCEMAEKKDLFEEMKRSARNAQFICACCGRVAGEKERLCAPADLYGGKEKKK